MSADDEEKARLEREIYRTIIHRDSRQTNIIEVFTNLIENLAQKLQSYIQTIF